MNGLLLAIAMLAVLALIAGGIILIVRQGQRQKGTLMIAAAAVILGNILIWTL